MKERVKRIWRKVKRRLPSVSRKGKVIRNFAFILLTLVLFWWAIGAPALTPQWRYRRAERRNLIQDTEIIAVLEPDWIGWEYPELVVAEDETAYYLCLTNDSVYAMNLQRYEKQGKVTLTGVPEQSRMDFFLTAIPLLVITELPAVRAELELTVPPELAWRWPADSVRAFAGAVFHGEDTGEDGVFSFDFPETLAEVDPALGGQDVSDQSVMEWDALYILTETLQGIKQQRDYDCAVTAHIRLWDAEDTLVYDEVLTYPIESVE